MLRVDGPAADLRLGAEGRRDRKEQRGHKARSHELRSARFFAQYSSRLRISRSKPRSGGS